MELNVADMFVRVNELQDVDVDTVARAISESACKAINFPFFILFFSVDRNENSITAADAKKYANRILTVIEKTSGINYSKEEKTLIEVCFSVAKCGKEYSNKERIFDIEQMIELYDDAEIGTVSWKALGALKRELLHLYSFNSDYFEKMKALIMELKPTDELYRKYIERDVM